MNALQKTSPSEAVAFETEYSAALAEAAVTLDIRGAEQVLNRWWGLAHLRQNPPTGAEIEVQRRLRAGEDVGATLPTNQLAG